MINKSLHPVKIIIILEFVYIWNNANDLNGNCVTGLKLNHIFLAHPPKLLSLKYYEQQYNILIEWQKEFEWNMQELSFNCPGQDLYCTKISQYPGLKIIKEESFGNFSSSKEDHFGFQWDHYRWQILKGILKRDSELFDKGQNNPDGFHWN